MLTAEQYALERAIVDRAEAYRERVTTKGRGGWSVLTAEQAAHPDYAACDNAMRGRVEQYEVRTRLPEHVAAYVGKGGQHVTTWAGDPLGVARVLSSWPVRSYVGSRMRQYCVCINGANYTGRGFGEGMLVMLRRVASERRAAA